MKKTLAIILSVVMLLGVMPFGVSAATEYDRAAIAANDEAYIADLTAEQIASVILDWTDREIAKATDDFETFEVEVMGATIAVEIPAIASLDDIIAYKDQLTNLGGDFAELDATNLITRKEAGSAIGFIGGVFQFMADNSETFGKVFRWDEEVFDYGKVGEYIESLDTTDPENKKIVDFYNNYLIGNNIQEWFIAGVAQEMNYTIPVDENGNRAETFDETISNGIINWFAGLCEANGILSDEGLATLKAYDLRDADIYAHVKNFAALVQSDNQVKIDTYYNYLLDTAVRTLLKTMVGQTATVGEAAENAEAIKAEFTAKYADLATLFELSQGNAYFQAADKSYYAVTFTAEAITAVNTLTWTDALNIELDPPVVNIYTGAGLATPVQTYKPNNPDFTKAIYATAKNQALIGDIGVEFAGTEVPEAATAVMVDANAKALTDGIKIETIMNGETSALDISFDELETLAEQKALEAAQSAIAAAGVGSMVTVESVDVSIEYKGWATEDDFIAQVLIGTPKVTLGGSMASFAQSTADSMAASAVSTMIDNPIATIVIDQLTGGKYDVEAIKGLMNYIDTDFVIDETILDIAGNYDAYKGAVGQVNHILVSLVNMLVSDSGEADLALTDGDNTNLYANLEKIAAKSDEVIGLAKEFLSGEEIKAIFDELQVNDLFASDHGLNLDMILGLDFSDVESMLVCGIEVVLDFIDDGSNALIAELHEAVEGLETLDAMAIAVANAKAPAAIAKVNETLGTTFAWNAPAAATVADGAAKDIIMTNLVDMAYTASEFVVEKLNTAINNVIANAETETGADLPVVNFELGVTKGATWPETLANLVNRAYELADGIIIACDNDYTDTFDKISAVVNAILPTQAMLSNCGKGEFAVDANTVVKYMFDDALEGNFNGILGMAEVKDDPIAGGVSVPKALINSCQHIVDAIFPGTVVSAEYPDALDVQETFTGNDSDQLIASNNMDSINARKADLVPAVLNLVREAGVLPFFAKCDKDHTAADLETVVIKGKDATCTEAGVEDKVACAECGYVVSGGETIPALNHELSTVTVDSTCTAEGTKTTTCSRCDYKVVEKIAMKAHTYGAWKVTKAATCTAKGVETRTCTCGKTETREIAMIAHTYGAWQVKVAATCEGAGVEARTCSCGKEETRAIAAIGHKDANGDDSCDACGKDLSEKPAEDNSFFGKIKAFFQRIIDWFRNLFK